MFLFKKMKVILFCVLFLTAQLSQSAATSAFFEGEEEFSGLLRVASACLPEDIEDGTQWFKLSVVGVGFLSLFFFQMVASAFYPERKFDDNPA